jgi:3'-phosphoadenosine 5'-phosphosulfate sulfotransferase (PAPS reductase)/FAD synthetase
MSGEKVKSFHPLSVISKEFEEWFIQEYKVEISDIYKEPYNFERTGCKGCPFALNLQNELDTLEKFFPNERKQCEIIWKPIYEEYRRIGYRLKRKEEFLLFDL